MSHENKNEHKHWINTKNKINMIFIKMSKDGPIGRYDCACNLATRRGDGEPLESF